MIDPRLWIVAALAAPAAIAGVSYLRLDLERLRALTVAAAGACLFASLMLLLGSPAPTLAIRSTMLTWQPGGEAVMRLDRFSVVLLALAAGLWLLTVAVTPRAALDRRGLRRTAVATLLTLGCFLTESAVVLWFLSAVSVGAFIAGLSDTAHATQRRLVAVYLGTSTALFAVGVALLVGPGVAEPRVETAGLWTIVVAALIRKGIVPFHAWVPELFDHGRLGPSILFNAPQVGAYMTAVLIVPHGSPAMLRVIAVLALGTAVYGAALALVQASARRALGYLFVSQSALVMAGLDCTSSTALTGGLVVWLSAGLAFAGLARIVLVLEARRGRMDLTQYHGGYERMPVLAITFLAMGLACTGFPGTLGFIGQELLVGGAVDTFPILGFAVVFAAALTGLAVARMYFSLFCGRPEGAGDGSVALGLAPREAWTFIALVAVLIGLGLFPRPLVDAQFQASDQFLQQRVNGVAR